MKRMIVDCSVPDPSEEKAKALFSLEQVNQFIIDKQVEADQALVQALAAKTQERLSHAVVVSAQLDDHIKEKADLEEKLSALNEQEIAFNNRITIVDMTPEEIAEHLAYHARVAEEQANAPKTVEQRLAETEQKLAQLLEKKTNAAPVDVEKNQEIEAAQTPEQPIPI